MINIQLEMAIASITLFIIIAIALKKNTISIKSSIAWLLLPIVFLCMPSSQLLLPLSLVGSVSKLQPILSFLLLLLFSS